MFSFSQATNHDTSGSVGGSGGAPVVLFNPNDLPCGIMDTNANRFQEKLLSKTLSCTSSFSCQVKILSVFLLVTIVIWVLLLHWYGLDEDDDDDEDDDYSNDRDNDDIDHADDYQYASSVKVLYGNARQRHNNNVIHMQHSSENNCVSPTHVSPPPLFLSWSSIFSSSPQFQKLQQIDEEYDDEEGQQQEEDDETGHTNETENSYREMELVQTPK